MAADQERADRIRQIKQENPGLKWRHIADHVGVELRSAQMWQETGAISYDNAKRLAELTGVDVDWIMRGIASHTPSPFAGQDAAADALAAIYERLGDLQDRLGTLEYRLEEVIGQRTKQTADIIQRLADLEHALNARTDALLPGIQELLAAAEESRHEEPAQTAHTAK